MMHQQEKSRDCQQLHVPKDDTNQSIKLSSMDEPVADVDSVPSSHALDSLNLQTSLKVVWALAGRVTLGSAGEARRRSLTFGDSSKSSSLGLSDSCVVI